MVVILVVAVLVAFLVWLARYMGREEQRRLAYIRPLAARLGGSVERDFPLRVTGTSSGRPYVLSAWQVGHKGHFTNTHIEVPLSTSIRLQIQPQTSDLGARMAGDEALGDAAFDAACFLRTGDVDALRRALDPEMRLTLADACERGDLRFVSANDGPLRLLVRGAPDDPDHESRVTDFLRVAVTLAARLDPAGGA
jgi:hypothetical protein